MKKSTLVVAAAVANAAKAMGGVAYVFSTRSKSVLREENASASIGKHAFAEFACASCSTKFHALASSSPFCFTCGGAEVSKSAETATPNIHPDNELVSITCGVCSTANVMASEVAKVLTDSSHCSACGTALMSVQIAETDTFDSLLEDLTDENASEDLEAPAADPVVDTPVADPVADAPVAAEAEPVAEDTPAADAAPAEALPVATDAEEAPVGDADPETADSDEMPMNAYPAADPVAADESFDEDETVEYDDVNMMDTVSDDNVDQLAVVAMNSRVLLACENRLFAELTKENAGANADIFATAGFQAAIVSSLREDGVKATMANFGFTPIVVKAAVAKRAQRVVAKAVEKEVANIALSKETLLADFKQSVDLAAVGINKSFWKNASNPLRDALVSELSSMGVRGAERLVANVFSRHGLDFTASLLKQTTELMAKSPAMRDELAEVLDMTNVINADDDSGEDIDFESAVSASVETAAERRETRSSVGARPVSLVASIVGSEPLFS